ncbi:MAG: DUF4358 domain-containing protein [Oscillospiraceae bacterium]|nr:DUF4358 domain-containing protein [Oscillospiraceae bacterium]
MRNIKPKKIINFLINITVIIIFISCLYSCEKKEPAVEANPDDIMKKILADFSDSEHDAVKSSDCIVYKSGIKAKELSEKTAKELYSESNKKNDDSVIDLSKIEKYSVRQSKENPAVEIGIFKLYDRVNADYIKDFMSKRISKKQEMQKENVKNMNSRNNINFLETANNAEVRSYGNYVYYVSHPQKDRIFKIIENSLRKA